MTFAHKTSLMKLQYVRMDQRLNVIYNVKSTLFESDNDWCLNVTFDVYLLVHNMVEQFIPDEFCVRCIPLYFISLLVDNVL